MKVRFASSILIVVCIYHGSYGTYQIRQIPMNKYEYDNKVTTHFAHILDE